MKLKETVNAMVSLDYKERFKAEYWQLKIRLENLRKLNLRIKVGRMMNERLCRESDKIVMLPKHDCPDWLLSDQQRIMEDYLDILEERAIIENIDLGEDNSHDTDK